MTVPSQKAACQTEQLHHLEEVLRPFLTDQARQLARETGFVQRSSPIDGAAFVQTLVFGFLDEPDASYTDLQHLLACQKILVSPQALAKRMTKAASHFLHRMVEALLTVVVVGETCALEMLSGFAGVYLQDGTIIDLPDHVQETWRGCGGRTGTGGEAGVRIQARLELKSGQLEGPWLQQARANERSGASSIEERPLPVGSLYVTDTGYATLPRMRNQNETGRYWLTPASLRPKIVDHDGIIWDLPALLATRSKRGQQIIDEEVFVGASERVPCRLIAVPKAEKQASTQLPPAHRDQRVRRKGSQHDVQVGRKKAFKGKSGRKHHRAGVKRRQLGNWIVLLTNVPVTLLSAQQARELMRARWQEELLWKLWKQQGHLDIWRSEKPMRILCELYAKLIGMLIQHWFTIVGCWRDPHRSLVKAGRAVKKLAVSVVLALNGDMSLQVVLARSQHLMQRCQLNPRVKHPNTSQRLIQASG
jgi:DDE family transposase